MQVTATASIVDWDHEARRIVVLNPGDTGNLSDALCLIHEGKWTAASALDHDGDGQPGGSIAPAGEGIAALRERYTALLGKKPFAGWGADELTRRIEAAGGAAPVGEDDEGGAPVA